MEQNKIKKIVKPVSEIKPKSVDLPEPKGDLEGFKKIKKVDPKKKKKKKKKAAGGAVTPSTDNTNYNAITEAVDGVEKSM